MPIRHPCATPRCPGWAEDGSSRCARCGARHKQQQAAQAKQYDAQGRPSWWEWYRTPRWRAERAAFLSVHQLCRCGRKACTVDHVRAHKGDPSLFWDHANWQPMCWPCHSRKTASRDGGFGNPKGKPEVEEVQGVSA